MKTSRLIARDARPTAVDRLAAVCAAVFIVILAISAYWDPSIRALHVFEAVPYTLAAALTLRQRKFGYFLGAASGAFWLGIASTQTSFVRNGFERVAMLVTTGHVDRWDQFIAAPAALATGGLAIFSAWGYARLGEKSLADLASFVLVSAGVVAFFWAIFWLLAERYLVIFDRLLGG